MKPLEPPDSIHLEAAKGWCGLKDYLSANEELEEITPLLRAHPDVLEVRWEIYSSLNKHEGALDIATTLWKQRPERWMSWHCLASSFLKTGQIQDAYRVLEQAALNFPKIEECFYEMACICCSLNDIGKAKLHLSKAIDLGGDKIKLKALDDEALKLLWENIGDVEI